MKRPKSGPFCAKRSDRRKKEPQSAEVRQFATVASPYIGARTRNISGNADPLDDDFASSRKKRTESRPCRQRNTTVPESAPWPRDEPPPFPAYRSVARRSGSSRTGSEM